MYVFNFMITSCVWIVRLAEFLRNNSVNRTIRPYIQPIVIKSELLNLFYVVYKTRRYGCVSAEPKQQRLDSSVYLSRTAIAKNDIISYVISGL